MSARYAMRYFAVVSKSGSKTRMEDKVLYCKSKTLDMFRVWLPLTPTTHKPKFVVVHPKVALWKKT